MFLLATSTTTRSFLTVAYHLCSQLNISGLYFANCIQNFFALHLIQVQSSPPISDSISAFMDVITWVLVVQPLQYTDESSMSVKMGTELLNCLYSSQHSLLCLSALSFSYIMLTSHNNEQIYSFLSVSFNDSFTLVCLSSGLVILSHLSVFLTLITGTPALKEGLQVQTLFKLSGLSCFSLAADVERWK